MTTHDLRTLGTADGQQWQQTQRAYVMEQARAEAEQRAHAAGLGARAAFAYVVAFVHAAEDAA